MFIIKLDNKHQISCILLVSLSSPYVHDARSQEPWGPPSLLYDGYRVFPGGKERPGRDADPSPPSSTMVKKE